MKNASDWKFVETFLAKNDIPFYMKGIRICDARKEFHEEFTNCEVRQKEFKESIIRTCKFWKMKTKRDRSARWLLSESQWRLVENAVESVKDHLRGQSLSVAVEIVRSVHPVNNSQLDGLTKRFHYWESNV